MQLVNSLGRKMIPAGYMAKKVSRCPEWLKTSLVSDIYSVSNCISEDFTDYINYWEHNGYWFFDSAEAIESLAVAEGIDLSRTTLFYYEVYEKQFHEEEKKWQRFEPEFSFRTQVIEPKTKKLEGFDVVSFSGGSSAECSPLSCNHMAREIQVNRNCLLETFDEAKLNLEKGIFKDCEPGPYRIFAVYTVPKDSENKSC